MLLTDYGADLNSLNDDKLTPIAFGNLNTLKNLNI